MKYLLVCSSPFENSTLSKISKNVIENLIGDNEIYCLAHCENQTIYKKYKNASICPIFDFENQFEEALIYFKPDVLITIGDISECVLPHYHKKSIHYTGWKWISILDIGTIPPPPGLIDFILNTDHIVTYSLEVFKFLNNNPNIDVHYARLGVEKDLFYVLPNKKEIKESFKNKEIFTILSPGSNNRSNEKSTLIEAFAEFSKDKNNVFLYFCDRDNSKYYDLKDIAWKYPWILDKIMFTDDGVDNHVLNNLYNSVDLTIDLSVNSTFNLSILEALSCECSVVIPHNPINNFFQYPNSDYMNICKSHKFINQLGGEEWHSDVYYLKKIIEEKYFKFIKEKEDNEQKSLNITNEKENDKFSWENFNSTLKVIIKNILNKKNKETFFIKV